MSVLDSTVERPLLRAKLQTPQLRRTTVARARLLDRLRAGRDRRLTLVCAPAGYGKTTLLAQWAREDGARTPFVWLSLDASDSDATRLWSHLIHGLESVHPPVGATSAATLHGGPSALAATTIPLLIEELEGAPPLVLVLEDWHAVHSSVCDETLRQFIEHRPDAVQVVVSSRSDPALGIARLRAHDQLAEVREEQLRLLQPEAQALFAGAGFDLEPHDVERLRERTEGWAAGLHLAALLMQAQADRPAFVQSFSGESRHVLDYLARDVLDTVPADMRHFLLETSLLERLSAPLCDSVLERTGSAALLAEIERANLFLVPLDGEGRIYRYHALFAAMLRRELERTDPGALPRLHGRASRWFEADGDVEAATGHAIAARDVGRASDLIVRHARSFWNVGRGATVIRWLDQLSWPEAIADPPLAIMRAQMNGFTARPAEEIERWLEVAAAGPHEGPLANGMTAAESGIALVRSIYLTRGLEVAEEQARRTVELERPGSPWRVQALLALGQARYLLGRAEEARAALEEANAIPGAAENAAGAANVLAYLALIDLDSGRVAVAESQAAVDLLAAHHLTGGFALATPLIALGANLAAGRDLHGAVGHLERAVAMTPEARASYWRTHALLRLARARHRLGDHAAATLAVDAARADLAALPDAGMLGPLLAQTQDDLLVQPRREGFLGEKLSDGELRVLRLLAAGLSVRDIAGELYLSPNTVKTHRRAIYRKLGVSSRTEAAVRAAELGL